MTGRKDIPPIFFTYSPSASTTLGQSEVSGFLSMLENQRAQLHDSILSAPKYRLDHLVSFTEFHAKRLKLMVEELISFRKKQRVYYWQLSFWAFIGALVGGGTISTYIYVVQPFGLLQLEALVLLIGSSILGIYLTCQL